MWCIFLFQIRCHKRSCFKFLFAASSTPFRVRVNFDQDEFRTNMDPTIADTSAAEGDFFGRPGGFLGILIFE